MRVFFRQRESSHSNALLFSICFLLVDLLPFVACPRDPCYLCGFSPIIPAPLGKARLPREASLGFSPSLEDFPHTIRNSPPTFWPLETNSTFLPLINLLIRPLIYLLSDGNLFSTSMQLCSSRIWEISSVWKAWSKKSCFLLYGL